ncbi:MAG: bifunctional diguanylate cyclase/phosphodiesterase [Lachnospiraceae bacterium]|nr:bifunctional diguanylate cyclase/phosphodiesterase [Lachnospiraceae bacterium]
MTFGEILSKYYTFIFIMVVLLYTIAFNKRMYQKVRVHFWVLIALVILEAICSGAETYCAAQPYRTIWRSVFSSLCYILRPSIMYALLLIIVRDDPGKRKALYGIPLLVIALLLLADIPYSYCLIYTFSEANFFSTGPLFFLTYGILLLYLLLIIILTIVKCNFSLELGEWLSIFIGIAFILLNIAGERFIPGFTGGNSENATALAILLYAIHFKSIEDHRERKILETTELKTGLLNENACITRLNGLIGKGNSHEYAAVFFDLERFGLINDRYGMEIGNRVISEYAAILGGMVREDEILARQGGDRFIAVVLQRNLDLILAQIASTRVRFNQGGMDYDITISAHVGVYRIDRDDYSGEEIISNANTALNYGKGAGNSVTYMTPELKIALKDEKQYASDIPVAMANGEFVAYYQPKVNSRTNMLCGAEALVRWSRNGKLIPPGKFIPIMETKDLMCDMDFYMLRRVCSDISGWIERGLVPPTVSVNFSRRNLSNDHLAEDIDAVVKEYHVPKKMIEIEITETIDEFPISVLKNFVDDLHRLGYKVAVDDFGSGSSSLSLLREVTFDTLKIDKGFVDRAYAKDLAILSHMIKLAKAIGLETLAEGVEQREQVDTLLSLGCEIIQGYYFDRPLPKESFEGRIINRRYKVEQS